MNDKLQKNPKGTYIRETREMAENAAKKNPECNFIGLDESVRTTYVKKKRSS